MVWEFRRYLRANAFGWKASRLAAQRVKAAATELAKAARTDPAAAAEGAVIFCEKLYPAVQHVDDSWGTLGAAARNAVHVAVDILVAAELPAKTRAKYLDRLWQAHANDGWDLLAKVADRWGELCADAQTAAQWAGNLRGPLEATWTAPGYAYFAGAAACLSCLLYCGRDDELLALLEHRQARMWHYRRYGVEALRRQGRNADALRYAEATETPNRPDAEIARTCADILRDAGLAEDAYRRYGLASIPQTSTALARFKALAKAFPTIEPHRILDDLITDTPGGEEGLWFATALNAVGDRQLALQLATRPRADPKTINAAAAKALPNDPAFARDLALASLQGIAAGHGYGIDASHARQAHHIATTAARTLDLEPGTLAAIDDIIAADQHDFLAAALE